MTEAYRLLKHLEEHDHVEFVLPDGVAEVGEVTGVDDTPEFREVVVESESGRRYRLDIVKTLDSTLVGVDRWDRSAEVWTSLGETADVRRVTATV